MQDPNPGINQTRSFKEKPSRQVCKDLFLGFQRELDFGEQNQDAAIERKASQRV